MNDDMVTLLRVHFQLVAPVSIETLKERFRQRCKELHPDINPFVDRLAFIKMKEAYDLLIEDGNVFTDTIQQRNQRTVEGIFFSSLGLGLKDPLKNGTTCSRCNGLGRNEETRRGLCKRCSGHGRVDYFTCPDCKGTGVFFQPRAKRNVTCRRCEGEGSFSKIAGFWGGFVCPDCRGTGYGPEEKVWFFCAPCQGTGEIEIFNPVIPKNLLLNMR